MKLEELNENYKKITLRFAKENDCFGILERLQFKRDNYWSFLDVFNNSLSWNDTKEGYEYWYSIAIKFSIFCYKYYSNIIDKKQVCEYLQHLTFFSAKYVDKKWYKEAINIITAYDLMSRN